MGLEKSHVTSYFRVHAVDCEFSVTKPGGGKFSVEQWIDSQTIDQSSIFQKTNHPKPTYG